METTAFAPFSRAAGDDELFLMDEFLMKDINNSNSSSSSSHSLSQSHSLPGMESFDHVDALLLGFDLDVPLESTALASSASAFNQSMTDSSKSMEERKCMSNDGSASPTTTDDMSGSETSSPPPSFNDDGHHHHHSSPSSSPVRAPPQRIATSTVANNHSPLTDTSTTSNFAPGVLPYALPVAYFPTQPVVALNMNQKRPFQPEVLPNAHPTAISTSTSASGDATLTKKSKREIRQMKNRESANKSRLRRKAQMSELSDEVQELTKKQHELQNTIAALRAENKSLHDQNSFLRSLVAKPSAGDDFLPQQQLTDASMFADSNFTSLSAMESGQQMEIVPQKKNKMSRATTFSAASLSLCASVFGITILSDSEGGSSESSHIRRPGRILHSLPASIESGFSPAPQTSVLDFIWDTVVSSWTFLSSSELAFGVLLNVLSFVVIMGLYHMWQSSFTTSTYSVQKVSRTHANVYSTSTSRTEKKKRSVSWQDIRLRDNNSADDSGGSELSSLPRVRDLL